MTLVIDASVAVKWVFAEDGTELADDMLRSENERIAPDFLLLEISNVLRTKLMRAQMDEVGLRAGYAFVKASISCFVPDGSLADRALELAAECGHSVYDCMYLACAERERTTLVTADRRFVERFRTSRYGSLIWPLAA